MHDFLLYTIIGLLGLFAHLNQLHQPNQRWPGQGGLRHRGVDAERSGVFCSARCGGRCAVDTVEGEGWGAMGCRL